ncbi:MAG: glycosyltransferase [Deltaproteobacteria bacterium]
MHGKKKSDGGRLPVYNASSNDRRAEGMQGPRFVIKDSVCCIIVTYNIDDTIFKVVDGIAKQVGLVVLVDNGSSVDTRNRLKTIAVAYGPKIRLELLKDNVGIAAGLNFGVKIALEKGFEWVLTLDHDSIATPGMIEALLRTYERFKDRNPGIVSPQHIDRETGFRYRYVKYSRLLLRYGTTDSGPLECSSIMSSGNLIRKEVFRNAGLYREDYFIYAVDNNFCRRVIRKNYSIIVSDEAVLRHREGELKTISFFGITFSTPDWKSKSLYYVFRNVLYDLREVDRISEAANVAMFLLKLILTILFFKGETRSRRFKAVALGVRDGIRGRLGKSEEYG